MSKRLLVLLVLWGCGPAEVDPSAGAVDPLAVVDKADIAERLRAIPGMEVTERNPGATERVFDLRYQQPADHVAPQGQTFMQRMELRHRAESAPMVLFSSGYSLGRGRSEVTQLVQGNQLSVEHRFFTPSRPDPANWDQLTIEQAAADHHRIIEALRPIYGGRWISTGASKGGMTALFHRRFYPGDVDATVAYVAPISRGAPDDRYVQFMEQVGDSPCRQSLKRVQRQVLERREAMLARLRQAAQTGGLSYEVLGFEKALEHAVLELPYVFWQYGSAAGCLSIPGPNVSDAALYNYLDGIVGLSGLADGRIAPYAPYFHQAGTQFGYPAFAEAHLGGLLHFPGSNAPQHYVPERTLSYDPASMEGVASWVATGGERLMFVYGESDPWSSAMVELGGAADSYRYVVASGNHGSAIWNLSEPKRSEAIATVMRWSGTSILPFTLPQVDLAEDRAIRGRHRALP
jgi:hypothetical protein